MSTETPYNPYAAFENMADEDVVLKAKQEDNARCQKLFFNRRRTRGYHSGRNDRPL